MSKVYKIHISKEMQNMPQDELLVTVVSTVLATQAQSAVQWQGVVAQQQHGHQGQCEPEELARERDRVGNSAEAASEQERMERARLAWERTELAEHMQEDHGMTMGRIEAMLGPLFETPTPQQQQQGHSYFANGIRYSGEISRNNNIRVPPVPPQLVSSQPRRIPGYVFPPMSQPPRYSYQQMQARGPIWPRPYAHIRSPNWAPLQQWHARHATIAQRPAWAYNYNPAMPMQPRGNRQLLIGIPVTAPPVWARWPQTLIPTHVQPPATEGGRGNPAVLEGPTPPPPYEEASTTQNPAAQEPPNALRKQAKKEKKD